MALNDYAYYNTTTGLIENVIWIEDDVAPTLTWPDGYAIVDIPTGGVAGVWSMCGIGWSYINGQFVEPPYNPIAASVLTANINATDNTIPVISTIGFAPSGSLVVGQEIMSYSGISGTAITGVARGLNNTEAVEHAKGDIAQSFQAA